MLALRRDLFNEATPHELDLLDHGPLVEEVADILQTERTPLTVMINGPWGSGKTSFLRALVHHIQTLNRAGRHSRRTATIWFDPWEHEDAPNIIVPFLNRLRQEAYRDDEERRETYSDKEKSLLSELLWMLVPDELQHLLPGGTVHPHSLRQRMRGVLRFRQKRLDQLFDGAGPLRHKPGEQLSTRIRQQFVEYIQAIVSRGFDRVVILLDDLDRCQPHVMRKLLELVKVNLLGAAGLDRDQMARLEVVFVFAIDHQTLIQAVNEPESATPSADYSRYLDKIFDLRISLPRVVSKDVGRLLDGLLSSRHPDVHLHLNRTIDPGAQEPNTYRGVLVKLVKTSAELRSARFLRRMVNKLMVFSFVDSPEDGLLGNREFAMSPTPPPDWPTATQRQIAALLIIGWRIFGQAWLTTQAMALRDDGMGLMCLLDLWHRSRDPRTVTEAMRDATQLHLSIAGIRFLMFHIVRQLGAGAALLDSVEAYYSEGPGPRLSPISGPQGMATSIAGVTSMAAAGARPPTTLDDLAEEAGAIVDHLTRLDHHVRRNFR